MRLKASLLHRIDKAFRESEPIKTGNMARDATQIRDETIDGKRYHIISINPRIAPYSVYTVIPWSKTSPLIWRSKKHPEWNGVHHSFLYNHEPGSVAPTTPKQNPNEGWIYKSLDMILGIIREETGGKIVKGRVQERKATTAE